MSKIIIGLLVVGVFVIIGVGLYASQSPVSSILIGTVPPDPVITTYHFSDSEDTDDYNFYVQSTDTSTAKTQLKAELQNIITNLN